MDKKIKRIVKKTFRFSILYILTFLVIKLLIFKEKILLGDCVVILASTLGAYLYNYFNGKN